MVPVARLGTPLYFDFSKPQTAKTLIFELAGEAGLLVDDGWDGPDPEAKEPSMGPLSLVNKIKPYRFVASTELGAWGGLIAA